MSARVAARRIGCLVSALWFVDALPSVAAIPPLRRRLVPPARSGGARIALTFDDGPHPEATPRLLDLLGQRQLHATFFVLARAAEQRPALVRRIVAEGHEVGVHGVSHRPHLLRPPVAVALDVLRARRTVEQVTGIGPRYWRPPHGIPTAAGLAAARAAGMRPVLWTGDGRDWSRSTTPELLRNRLLRQLRPGAVALLHDSDVMTASCAWQMMIAALPDVLDRCAERGWLVGSLGELEGTT